MADNEKINEQPQEDRPVDYGEFQKEVKKNKSRAKAPLNSSSRVKRVIGVISGKGGVGKTFVSSYLAVLLRRRGLRVAIMDADVTGASIPTAFGMNDVKMYSDGANIWPGVSLEGIQIVSSNLLIDHPGDPVIWRGPMAASLILQFWSQVAFDADVMIVDCPPGTSDIQLTLMQQLPLDGLILAETPQGLVNVIAQKAYNMAKMMDIPVLGAVLNMAYVTCPHCLQKIYPFGEPDLERIRQSGIPLTVEVPFDPRIADFTDHGTIEKLDAPYLDDLVDGLMTYFASIGEDFDGRLKR